MNGLMTYDRQVSKLPEEYMAALNSSLGEKIPVSTVRMPSFPVQFHQRLP